MPGAASAGRGGPGPDRDPVRVERDESVAVVTIDRAPVNALDTAGYARLGDVLAALDRDDAVRAVVLGGAGSRAFSAGTDTAEFGDVGSMRRVCSAALDFFTVLDELDTPVVAALNGAAIGGGAMIAARCDVLVAHRSARLGIPELGLGFPGGGSHLAQLLPRPVALRMLLLGEQLDASALLAHGVVADVVDDLDALRDTALRHARTLAALDPAAMAPARRIVRRAGDAAAIDGYHEELAVLRRVLDERLAGAG